MNAGPLAGRRSTLRVIARACLVAVCASALVGLALGSVVSRALWGYYVLRPPLPRAVREVSQLLSLTPLKSSGNGRGCTLERLDGYSVTERIAAAAADPYYAHEGRLLALLSARGLHPESGQPKADLDLSSLYAALKAAGVVRSGDPGYDSAGCLRGVAVELVDDDSHRWLVLALHGGQVSNDHYPYYEIVLAPGGGGWRLSSHQMYFYDVAGIEGFEWPALHLLLAGAALVVLVFLEAAWLIVGGLRRRWRRGDGGD
jgi:hypothetical protein